MKLIFCIPDKLWWIQNFLSYNMYKNIHNEIIKKRKNINLKTSKNVWKNSLINNIIAPMVQGIDHYKPFEDLTTLIKHNAFLKMDKINNITTNIFFMKKNSGINWHSDDGHTYGATYYLNNRWNKQWGGEFMFTHSNGHGWIPIIGNSLIVVKTPIFHKVNPVLTSIVPRISVQMFIKG